MCYITHRTKEEEMISLPDIHKSTLRVSPIVQTLVYVMKGSLKQISRGQPKNKGHDK